MINRGSGDCPGEGSWSTQYQKGEQTGRHTDFKAMRVAVLGRGWGLAVSVLTFKKSGSSSLSHH